MHLVHFVTRDRVRLSSIGGRSIRAGTICEQFELQERLPHQEREYVDVDVSMRQVTKSAVCVSSLMIDEIKRIIKDSEIVKYVVALPCPRVRIRSNALQGRRHQMAAEEQGRPTGTGNSDGQ